MADIIKAINDLDSAIGKVRSNVGDAADEIKYLEEQISSLEKITDLNEKQKKQLKERRDIVIGLRAEQRTSSEQERTALENIIGKNKTLADTVKELSKHHKHLAGALHHSAGAYNAFTKSADIGKTIQHIGGMVGSFIPGVKSLGAVLGFVVGAAIKAQDRIQAVNKTIIDLSASTGKFGEGMSMANDKTVAMTAGFARYGQSVGMASKEVQDLAGDLGKVGFTMEEMGIDKHTGEIKSLSSALNSNVGEWGALSTVVGAARATGLGYGQVASQLQIQVKDLGDTVQGTGKTFAALSVAANRSRLSTGILLPVLQQVQSSFKNIGLDSAKAVEMLGRAGEAAKKAGVGAGAAVDVMGKAISGMANMDMGKMAFLGQQLGMGGGLGAGLQFRKQISDKEGGGAEIAQQIGQVIGKIMGGSGDLVSEEQAIGNERLAAIRVGQEQLASQMFGFSQNESRVFINISKQLSDLNSAGQGDSEEAKKLNKELSNMKMSESDYRKKTLTAQQKIQNLMELITTLVGNMVVIFVRAFAGGAGAAGGLGKGITEVLNSIKTGEGSDTLSDRISGLGESLEKTVGSAIASFGDMLGRLLGYSLTTAIGLALGGGIFVAKAAGMFSSFITNFMQKSITEMAVGAGGDIARAIEGTKRGGSAVGSMLVRGAGMTKEITTRAIAAPVKVATSGLSKFAGFLGTAGTALTIFALTAGLTYAAMKVWNASTYAYADRMNKETAAANVLYEKHTQSMQSLSSVSRMNEKESFDLVRNIMSQGADAALRNPENRSRYGSNREIINLQAKEEAKYQLSVTEASLRDSDLSASAREKSEAYKISLIEMIGLLEKRMGEKPQESNVNVNITATPIPGYKFIIEQEQRQKIDEQIKERQGQRVSQ